ncbi:MAG TPA: hypothetical protein VIY08_03090 [Candidatus Nitrosocosmicus sp.]
MTGKSKELKSEVQLEQADEKILIEEPENKELNKDNLWFFFEFLYKGSLDTPILSDVVLNMYTFKLNTNPKRKDVILLTMNPGKASNGIG